MGYFLSRHLQQKLPGVLKARRRVLFFEQGDDIPTRSDLQVGAKELVRDQVAEFGEAQIQAASSDDIALVEISVTEATFRVVKIAAAFSYSFDEEMAVEAASKNGYPVNIRTTKMETVVRVIAEKVNRFACYGDSKLALTGFCNNASVTLQNSSFDPYASTTTPQDLADFILEEMEAIATSTNNVEYPTDLRVSSGFYYKLTRTPMPDTGKSVMEYIKGVQGDDRTNPAIQRISLRNELNSANLEAAGVQSGGTNKDRFVLYPLSPEILHRHNRPTTMYPSEYTYTKGTTRYYPMYQCTSETIIEFPAAMRYIDVAKRP